MPKACVICHHPSAHLIDHDLASGLTITQVSLKHIGNYSMLNALLHHRWSHVPNLPLETRPRQTRAFRDAEEGIDNVVVAVEPVRVRGIVYEAGDAVPVSHWNNDCLLAALRVGTVRRNTSVDPTANATSSRVGGKQPG